MRADRVHTIPEADWKLFKPLREIALRRYYERVIADVQSIGSDLSKSARDRYVEIFRLVKERDKDIDWIFDHLRRSTAFQQLAAFRRNELISDEELSAFSAETRELIESFLGSREA